MPRDEGDEERRLLRNHDAGGDRSREKDEPELASLREVERRSHGRRVVAALKAQKAVDDADLDQREHHQRSEEQLPKARHGSEIDGHAHRHEKEPQQETAERLDVRLELVPITRLGEHDARQKCAERRGKAGIRHEPSGGDHHEERGRRHDLARPRAGEDAEERIQEIATHQ